MTDLTAKGRALLDCPMGDNDANAKTVLQYIKKLLTNLFREGEGFSGKRPFGNSGWEREVAEAWVKAGLIPGQVTTYEGEDYCDCDFHWDDFKDAVDTAIFALHKDR